MAFSWLVPDGFVDSMSVWTDEALAYDGNTGTFAYCPQNGNMWQDWLRFTFSTPILNATKLRIWVSHEVGATLNEIDIHLYNTETQQSIYQDTMVHDQYNEITGITLTPITYVQVRFSGLLVGSLNLYLNEIALWGETVAPEVTTSLGAHRATNLARRFL